MPWAPLTPTSVTLTWDGTQQSLYGNMHYGLGGFGQGPYGGGVGWVLLVETSINETWAVVVT